MEKKLFEKFDGAHVTDEMLQEASKLFSENYGVWSEHAKFAKAGSRVRLSKERLRSEYILEGISCSYVRVSVNGYLAGNAFACRWNLNGKTVCWITQLVVHRTTASVGLYRSRLPSTSPPSLRIDTVAAR
ncbi:hypothetical protein K469DRAFT_684020 [Zopfia rhizophila CBS 207.26]|uniref:Uncharacterized protein n=1 Tax=Zopfia rhizophila CBS 207.26 TaxID=1314779 RepID=A0A6A6D8C8_9PEZI|nr:hypothetical protein K469DRAFT_684020 [Zopfia rhizophila CBS 207.26]